MIITEAIEAIEATEAIEAIEAIEATEAVEAIEAISEEEQVRTYCFERNTSKTRCAGKLIILQQ